MIKSIFVFLLFMWGENFCNADEINLNTIEHNKTMRFELRRQKSQVENLLYLKTYGSSFIDLGKKHKHKMNRTNDSIALYRYMDNEFYGEIVIGHPGQKFKVAFDTTWMYSWIISSRCNALTELGCAHHNKYNHDKSSEYKKDGRPFSVNQKDYAMKGFFSYDNISFAHSNVTNQSFIEMTSLPKSFALNKADGVMGLGRRVNEYSPFFYTLLQQKKINSSIFSIYMNRNTASSHGGSILLGFIDPKHIHTKPASKEKMDITWLPLDNTVYWQFSMDQVILDLKPKPSEIFCSKGCKAITDSSSTSIIGPPEDIKKIHDAIGAKALFFGRYTVDCDTIKQLPRIHFVLQGKNFTLKGPSYVTKFSYMYMKVCLSSFEEDPGNSGLWVLGGSFLSEYYSIYDTEKEKIGLVQAAT